MHVMNTLCCPAPCISLRVLAPADGQPTASGRIGSNAHANMSQTQDLAIHTFRQVCFFSPIGHAKKGLPTPCGFTIDMEACMLLPILENSPYLPTARTTVPVPTSSLPAFQLEEQRTTQDPSRSAVRRRRGVRFRGKGRKPRADSTNPARLPRYHRPRGAAKRGPSGQARPRPPPREKMLPVAANPGARRARYPGGRGGGEDTGFVSRVPCSSPPPAPTPTAAAHPSRV